MNFLIEASPEILISLIIVLLAWILTKGKLSKTVRNNILYVYSAGLLITVVLLYQSNTTTQNTLQVNNLPSNEHDQDDNLKVSAPESHLALADTKDLSPKTLTSEESTERLERLIEAQKESVSIDN